LSFETFGAADPEASLATFASLSGVGLAELRSLLGRLIVHRSGDSSSSTGRSPCSRSDDPDALECLFREKLFTKMERGDFRYVWSG
jgi:hypothetical protein